MALIATDWTITRSTGVIDYIGAAHGVAAASYATVIQLHRWLQGLADDSISIGDDELAIADILPTSRATDNLITLIGGYTITATAAEHLYDGTIVQGTTGVDQIIWDGIVNFGNEGIIFQLIQNGVVIANDYWNTVPNGETLPGLNRDNANGISHRFMIKVHDFVANGGDIDGRRLIGTNRTYNATDGYTYSEFKINGTSGGNNVLALSDASDLNNSTPIATIAAITDVYIDRTITTTTVNGVNASGQNILNVIDGTQFVAGGFIMINGDQHEYQIISIATNALTLNHNLDISTVGAEALYNLNIGFSQIDVNNDTITENYYAQWDRGANSINTFYERMKWICRDGTTQYIYGISGELFRGITHEIVVDTPTGTFANVESLSWGTGVTAGTGQLFAIDSVTAGTKIWIQLLTGIAPSDNLIITGGISGATVTVNVTVTDRSSLITTPFVGASTGSAIIGSYGLTLQITDLSSSDKVFDLSNIQITPPNNVQFNVNGIIATEDYVFVGPWDGIATDANGDPEVDYNQLSLSTTLNTDNITAVVVTTAIPSDTPATGYIRVVDDIGRQRRLHYTSWTASTFTIDTTNGEEDFLTTNATSGNNVFITYIDVIATTTTESFTFVYNVDRKFVIKVRDGGSTPIKEYITSGTMGVNGGSSTAIRTTDV